MEETNRISRRDAEDKIDAFLWNHFFGSDRYTLVEDGETHWAFFIEKDDTTSYVSNDGVEWLGTQWCPLAKLEAEVETWKRKFYKMRRDYRKAAKDFAQQSKVWAMVVKHLPRRLRVEGAGFSDGYTTALQHLILLGRHIHEAHGSSLHNPGDMLQELMGQLPRLNIHKSCTCARCGRSLGIVV